MTMSSSSIRSAAPWLAVLALALVSGCPVEPGAGAPDDTETHATDLPVDAVGLEVAPDTSADSEAELASDVGLEVVADVASDADGPDLPGPVGYATSADGVFDPAGRQIILRAVNFPKQDYVAEDFARVAGWGVNTLRQLYFWADVEPVEGQIDWDFVEVLARQVALAKEHGLYVILDMHQHCYSVGFLWGMPRWTCDESYYARCDEWDCQSYSAEPVQACFERFWTSDELQAKYIAHMALLAERFADEPTVIGFDVMNEPFCLHAGLDGCGELLGGFYRRAADAIHAVAPGKLVVFEPSYVELAGFETSLTGLDFPGGVYGAHYYLMTVHDGADYDGNPGPIADAIALRAAEARAMDVPLFIGEFGGMASVAGFDQYIDDHMDLFDQHLAGSAYWLYEFGDGFHMLDPEGQERPFVDVFVRPYARLTPGVLTAMSYDRETRVFSVAFDGRADVSEPGVLFVPARHYPDGYTLTGCDEPACRFERDDESQTVWFSITGAGPFALRIDPD